MPIDRLASRARLLSAVRVFERSVVRIPNRSYDSRAVGQARPLVNTVQQELHRVNGLAQVVGDLLIGEPIGEYQRDRALGFRQRPQER